MDNKQQTDENFPTISLEARVVLAHLNEMGYRNITAEQLKEFIRDLKKLIKYEERLGVLDAKKREPKQPHSNFLHQASTLSFQAKIRKEDQPTKPVVCTKQKSASNVSKQTKFASKSAPARLEPSTQEKVPLQRRNSAKTEPTSGRSSRMWIRPRPATTDTVLKTNDPVQRYHYYKQQWERFKNNLPGENDHSELRWRIRHKLLGCDD